MRLLKRFRAARLARSGSSVHRRADVLRAVIVEADARRDGSLPTHVPGVAETFASDFDLVATLQLRWHARLAGTIDRTLLDRPGAPAEAVVTAWRRAAAELPGVRLILDRYASDPTTPEMARALGKARRKEWLLLAAMADMGTTAADVTEMAAAGDTAAVQAGRALEERARRAGRGCSAPSGRRPEALATV
jgi:hypothetical protein